MTSENYTKVKFQCTEIKFYWNTAMFICICIVCSCFCSTVAELTSCNKECVVQKI